MTFKATEIPTFAGRWLSYNSYMEGEKQSFIVPYTSTFVVCSDN
jgi:hypothetical protein